MPDREPPLLLLPWESYSVGELFEYLQNIHSFEAEVQFPQFARFSDDDLMKKLVDRLYQEVFAILQEMGLGSFERLERFAGDSTSSGTSAGVNYQDDPFDFRVSISRDQSLSITRTGSSFKRFYEWYTALMPHFSRLVYSVSEEYESLVNKRVTSELHVTPSRVRYSYEFLLHDFKSPRRGQRVKNSRILQKTLVRVPGDDGNLVELDQATLPQLGRIDLSISRWSSKVPGVREIYKLSAPANREYGALWANFSYIGETGDSDALPRPQPDIAQLIRRVDLPLNDFLQKRALVNFLGTLTDEIKFSTSSGGLP